MSIRFNFNTPGRAINELTRLLPPPPPKKKRLKKIVTQSSTLLETPPFFFSPSRKGIFFPYPSEIIQILKVPKQLPQQ